VVYGRSREGALIYYQSLIYLKHTNDDPDGFRLILEGIEWILDDATFMEAMTKHELAFAYNLRAQCHHFLNEMEKAQEDYNKSIEVEPSEPRWYLNRAQYWDQRGQSELAETDRHMAQTLREGRATLTSPSFPIRFPAKPTLPSPTVSPFEELH
jgi:tetratricopeptide (TPR) repeat protein